MYSVCKERKIVNIAYCNRTQLSHYCWYLIGNFLKIFWIHSLHIIKQL